ncbi:MAG: hypothetical protein NTW60_02095 [Candidatus Wolfebacteria bacterium]|nr:hypothetical protein [Candidatus Wolfebacteria bacterium]
MKKISKKVLWILSALAILLVLFSISLFFVKPAGFSENIQWNISFSRLFASQMGLDWKEAFSAIQKDLRPKSVRLPVYWSDVEAEKGKYSFADYDWIVDQSEKQNTGLVLVVGRRLPRWPECHIPEWAKSLNQEEEKNLLLGYIKETVLKYRDSPALRLWQVENEPFLIFGECDLADPSFVDKEIALVRSLDPNHKIMLTDGGEMGLWFKAASRADVFGTTMYRKVYNRFFGYITYPLPPQYFWFKANLLHIFYPNKPIVISELQGEPWLTKMLYETSLDLQFSKMNLNDFRDNILYTKTVGFPEAYLWGSEWWYWLKTKQNHPEFWQAAKELINK